MFSKKFGIFIILFNAISLSILSSNTVQSQEEQFNRYSSLSTYELRDAIINATLENQLIDDDAKKQLIKDFVARQAQTPSSNNQPSDSNS